jgi:hypothetical protein
MLITEVLVNARGILLDKGWIKGNYRNHDGACCLDGALLYGIDGGYHAPKEYWAAKELVMDVVAAQYQAEGSYNRYYHIPSWNDTRDRTLAQVIDVLDTAIEIAEIEEELVNAE